MAELGLGGFARPGGLRLGLLAGAGLEADPQADVQPPSCGGYGERGNRPEDPFQLRPQLRLDRQAQLSEPDPADRNDGAYDGADRQAGEEHHRNPSFPRCVLVAEYSGAREKK